MMFEELMALLSYIGKLDAAKWDYLRAIKDENCLGKRSDKTRILTYRHLADLYSLDYSKALFRAMLFFWNRDIPGRSLLALLCAYARDPILRSTAPFILKFPEGATITREAMEEYIDENEPGRFSASTLKSTAQNVNSTWTKSGHLEGHVRKIRAHAHPTEGSVSYAMLLGYLTGVRGSELLQTEYFSLLDCPFDKAIVLAEDASRKGWIVFKRVGNVIEVLFPNLIDKEEMTRLYEQD
jgi:hypothetical protein